MDRKMLFRIDYRTGHTNRYRLFTLVYEAAVNNGQAHILPLMDTFGDDELFIYNKVNRLNCDLSRKLKQWWRKQDYLEGF